jgi:16S rRNA (cytosine1402-N4)-methyltransferase
MALHEPVMTAEVLSFLRPSQGGVFVDCTLGLGGHAAVLLGAGASQLIGVDRDEAALALARESLAPWADRVEFVHADYRELSGLLDARGIATVAAVVVDLGVSSLQLEAEGRGFSFQRDDPLDMRMDRSRGPTVADLIRGASEAELADVIFQFGEERHSRRVARAIVAAWDAGTVRTTRELADVVRRAIPRRGWARIDPATRTFQALRIWTNAELDGLDRFLGEAAGRLQAGGRMAVISFHSLEDRIVKHTFRSLLQSGDGAFAVLTKKPVVPGEAELARNSRSRSAKLRVIERQAA